MGGSSSNSFSDIVLEDMELLVLSQLDFTPISYHRYCDDIFAIVPANRVDMILDLFNKCDDRLKFTCEIEQDRSISFLD